MAHTITTEKKRLMFCSSPLKKNPTEIDWNCRGDAGNGGADFSRNWRDGAVDAIEFPVPRFKASLKLYKLVDYSLTYFSKVNKNSVPDNFCYNFFNLAIFYRISRLSIWRWMIFFRWTREWTSKSWLYAVVGRETWQKDLGADRRKGCGATCVGRIVARWGTDSDESFASTTQFRNYCAESATGKL